MADEKLDCGACRGCCYQVVIVLPGDDRRSLLLDPSSPVPVLARRADGSCAHLDPLLGCTIYERRPACCRAFHCGKWFRTLTPSARRGIELGGDSQGLAMLRSGEHHAQSR